MECPNPSIRAIADSPGVKDDSKTSKLGPDLPLGVHNQPQCAEIGANPFTLLLGPNEPKPGTRSPIHGTMMAAGSIVHGIIPGQLAHTRATDSQSLGTGQGRECTRGHCACVTLPLSDGAKRAQ